MSTKTSGIGHFQFTDEIKEEVNAEIAWEQSEVMSGRKENAILFAAVAGNWSVDQFFRVSRMRGRSWRFMSALADKALQLQGYALLDFVADAAGRDLAEAVLVKSLASLERAERIIADFSARRGENPFANQMYLDHCEDAVELGRETRHRYLRRVGRLLE